MRPDRLRTLALLVGAVVVAFFLLQLEDKRLFSQSRANLRFTRSTSIGAAIEDYPKTRPPAYPMLLRAADRAGLPKHHFNLVCFAALLVLTHGFARKYLRNVSPAVPIASLVACGAFYTNIHQVVSETLFVLVAFAIMTVVAAQRSRPRLPATLGLGVLAALGGLTRYFGLVWTCALTGVYVLLVAGGRSLKSALVHGLLFTSVVVACVSPWLLYVKQETGWYTGARRTVVRNLPPKLQHWNDQVDFVSNVTFAIKVTAIDLLSPVRFAYHDVMDGSLTTGEAVAFGAAGALAAGALWIAIRAGVFLVPKGERSPRDVLTRPAVLPLVFGASYVVTLVLVWSFSNNDPLYTRFVYPSYVFLLLSFVSLYSATKDKTSARWATAPCIVLFVAYLGLNAHRWIHMVS